MKPINMLDLKAEYPPVRERIREVVEAVLESQHFIGGPQVAALEERMSSLHGGAHAIAVSSGTDAILLALMAAEIGPGDEVITTPFTFFATAGCIHRTGAKPVFVDVEPDTFNIDVSKVEAAITGRTKAIVPVHLFGQCAEMDALETVATKHGLLVIEDAAQAIGATFGSRLAGTMGQAGCFSFYPTKNLGGFGEGGLVLTPDKAFAERCRQLRNHGQTDVYLHAYVGGNFRLDTMKAAILGVKLDLLEGYNARRRANAARYDALLADIGDVTTPVVRPNRGHCYHQYSILCRRRDELRAALADAKIGAGIYYPVPLHRQPCFASLGYGEGDLPVSEEASRHILSLPIHPLLSDEDVDRVASCIAAFYGSSAS